MATLALAMTRSAHHIGCVMCSPDAAARLPIIANARSFSGTTSASCRRKHKVRIRNALSAGPLPYVRGWAWQHALLTRRLKCIRGQAYPEQDGSDELLLFEHHPVYTLGRGSTEDHLTFLNESPDGGAEARRRLSRKNRGPDAARLMTNAQSSDSSQLTVRQEVDLLSEHSNTSSPLEAPNGVPIYRIERGGEVTYHGPGQLVMYPLLHLKHENYEQDLHWYLRQVEEVIIRTLASFDIKSNRDSINTGVWVGKDKIAAVGVSSSRWITTHGLALNVDPNLGHFDKSIITPCGIEERDVTSMSKLLCDDCPGMNEVADAAVDCFGEVFNVDVSQQETIR